MRPLASTDVATMSPAVQTHLMDFLFWTQHVHPRTTPANWPAGKVSSHVSVERALRNRPAVCAPFSDDARFFRRSVPETVHAKLTSIMRMTESDCWSTRLPFVSCSDDVDDRTPLWTAALRGATWGGDAPCLDAPVSTSVHEDTQLYYNRPAVPLCVMGDHCAAILYPGNQGALPIYLDPIDQAAYERTGVCEAPDPLASCLLCIRRDLHGANLAMQALLPNPGRQIHRSAVMPSPFANLVDVPGGYKRSAMSVTASPLFGGTNVVGVSGELRVNYDPGCNSFFFDQRAIKVTPPSFLSHGMTMRS
tara:strand:- start:1505 stop:2422 length:918 start_codon:yes stop_codon:yes gene_type:complete